MDLSAALTADILDLCSSIGVDPDSIGDSIRALTRHAQLTAGSYLGLQLVIDDHGQQTVLTVFDPEVQTDHIATSLRLPLALLRGSAEHQSGSVTFYASTPGAFVDLAADLTYVLAHPPTARAAQPRLGPEAAGLRLDRDLVPFTLKPGLVGAGDVSTINRAVGLLIGRGHEPEAAHQELVRLAGLTGVTVLTCAAQLLRPPPA